MERTVRLDDGKETILEQWGSCGPCIVAVHGITSSRKSWWRLGEALAGSFRVFAYDQRGHGDSADVDGPMTLRRCIADLRNVVDTLPEEPFALIGHSWGGAVALLGGIALRFRRVIAVDPMLYVAPKTWDAAFVENAARDLALDQADLERTLRARLMPAWHERDIEGKVHAMRAMHAATIRRLGSENRVDDGGWDLRAQLRNYPKPLLMFVAGPQESLIRSADLDDVRRWAGSQLELRLFEDQGHNLHRTAFDRFLTDTRAFLGRSL